jgi:hypothetical protein
MNPREKEARALKRQIRYVMQASGGRLGLESRSGLLLKIGQFLERMNFGSRREASQTLGISSSQVRHLELCYRKLRRSKKKVTRRRPERRLTLAPVRIVEEPVKSRPEEPRGLELMLEGGVRVSVGSPEAAIDLLERLEQRKRFRSAS